ncbi:synaptotagmin-like protein 3 [Bufo gargarizans]|uniref:synaptotagmin-like protein 3 n=1 Tax=Bufo gargarizans TaxID=30331 RepID=UPI001CF57E01|nr:synaptotagmin-like protein 3 [Bufo gargarizans]XP_044146263.1 synaptotagmin-like protein 3 [Bufo gargarizans]XP_044146264.1 synaptotagmin-like protein 3 [Bufo gargarizans]XP_044146265.1 synaptotagmin-like protein 3 [Bufo gargarizans]XP_044146266.1 synaptotagmin-like protein 3 [Bufo gargarizans]XP_044146267.1 synaptotagmin-like protein 3 [Bufo gargarizans]
MANDFNLSFLKELERERVLEVLYRDQTLQKAEEERIRKLKAHLQQLRWKGAKSATRECEERSCARCQKALGRLLNRGAVCNGCSHRVCQQCQVYCSCIVWRCTVCNAHGEVKIKTGEWFFEEREKKFPSAGKHETMGSKLLKSYEKMSKISIVPPTPPPFSEITPVYNSVELTKSKGFHKSVENIFLSLTTQVKKISRSQNDMTDKFYLSTDYGKSADRRKERRSHSDTAINIASELEKSSSLHQLIHKAREEVHEDRNYASQEAKEGDDPNKTMFFGSLKRSSMISINSVGTDVGSVTGEIELAISYNLKTCTLEILIKACKNLAHGEEKRKKCNPYVKTYLLPDKSPNSKMKTSVKKNTVDPSFNESLKYTMKRSQLETRTLQISVWHAGRLKRKVFLGEVLIPLEFWNFEDNSTKSFIWYQLKAKPKKTEELSLQYHGELCVKIRLERPPVSRTFLYEHMSDDVRHIDVVQLHLVIKSACNLSLRPDGFVSPFVKSCLILPNKQEIKQRTPVLRRKSFPEWNHTIIYNIENPGDLGMSRLDLTVWDQGLNERFLGGTSLSSGEEDVAIDCDQSAHLLWEQLLSTPNEWMEGTLLLQANKGAFHF